MGFFDGGFAEVNDEIVFVTSMKKLLNKIFPALGFYWHIHGWRLILLCICSFVSGAFESIGFGLLVPLLQKLFATQTAMPETQSGQWLSGLNKLHIPTTVEWLMAMFGIAILAKAIFRYISATYGWKLITEMVHKIRQQLIDGLISLDYKSYIGLESGKVSNVLTLEVEKFGVGFQYFVSYVTVFFKAVAFIVLLMGINPVFAFTIILLGSLYYLSVRWVELRVKKTSAAISADSARFNSFFIQSFQTFKYLKATASYDAVRKKLQEFTIKLRDQKRMIAKQQSVLMCIQEPVLAVMLFLAFFINFQLFHTPFSVLLLSVLLFYRATTYWMTAHSQWNSYISQNGSIESVLHMRHWLQQHAETKFGSQEPVFKSAISFESVSFSYNGKTDVLKDVSFVIPLNSTVAFVGRSGSGKSTLVNLLAGLLLPQTGAVKIDGMNIKEVDINSWRKKIGYVTQEPVLFADSIYNNITLWDSKPGDEDLFNNILSRSHLSSFVLLAGGMGAQTGDRGGKISGGQRQRITIAREFYKQPAVLIFDEATSSLDAETEAVIQQSIEELKGRVTTIVVAHRLSTIKNADIIFVLEDGKITGAGTFDELMHRKASGFFELVKLQTV